jgi:hypothetical protein
LKKLFLRVSAIVEIGFLELSRKVQTLSFVYIACAGERLLVLKVECRERSGRNNGSDLATRFGLYQVVSEHGCSRHCVGDDCIIMEAKP